jgi:hypothetical protein
MRQLIPWCFVLDFLMPLAATGIGCLLVIPSFILDMVLAIAFSTPFLISFPLFLQIPMYAVGYSIAVMVPD